MIRSEAQAQPTTTIRANPIQRYAGRTTNCRKCQQQFTFPTLEPDAPVDLTMARTLPLNAFRLVPLYEVVSVGSPLSSPTSWPGPETEKLTDAAPLGTETPLPSWMSPVMKARSRPLAVIEERSAERTTRAAAPAVLT